MKVVGIRDLKNRLSEYIRRVKAGEEVLVTERGEVVAELAPPRKRTADPDIPRELLALLERGLISQARVNDPTVYRRLPRCAPDGEAQRLLDEERGER